jgi:hypothetical protein
MREHEKELEMVADEWRDEVGEARAHVEELKDVSLLCFFEYLFEYLGEQRVECIRGLPEARLGAQDMK